MKKINIEILKNEIKDIIGEPLVNPYNYGTPEFYFMEGGKLLQKLQREALGKRTKKGRRVER